MARTLTEMAAEIVGAQAAHSAMSAEEISEALAKTFNALKSIKQVEESESVEGVDVSSMGEEPVSDRLAELRRNPMRSIQKNKVICLESGKEYRQLTNRHLKDYGLTTKEYRKKWGMSARQPLSAKALTAKRRQNAKERNLGEVLKKARMEKAGKKE